jgi:hypothetical protein
MHMQTAASVHDRQCDVSGYVFGLQSEQARLHCVGAALEYFCCTGAYVGQTCAVCCLDSTQDAWQVAAQQATSGQPAGRITISDAEAADQPVQHIC